MIAEQMGVTPATISKALRDGNDISEETRKKVKKVAAQLGYRPNLMARSLIRRRSNMIGVIVPDLRISFFSEVTRGIYEQADLKGFVPILLVHDELCSIERRNLEFLAGLPVEGILLNPAPGGANLKLYHQLKNEGIPIVCYDRQMKNLDVSSVVIDDEKAAFKITEALIENGCRNIMCLGIKAGMSVAEDRYRGYQNALEAKNIPLDPQMSISCDHYIQEGYRTMQAALDNGNIPDAVLCIGGLVAFGAGLAILNAKLRIPEDIRLAEFGDNDIISRLGVPFFTVNQNPYQMGRTAFDLLFDIIENKGRPVGAKHILIDTKLIKREIGVQNAEQLNLFAVDRKRI